MTQSSKKSGYSSLFQPDVVLPAQFASRRGNRADGERHLVLAILEDAVNCFRDHLLAKRESDRRLFREAEEWIMADDQRFPFSFLEICQILGIDPEYVRGGLKRWRQAQLLGATVAQRAKGKQATGTSPSDDA
jgi:hypothetical protein